jgi:Maltokinase N-terminal cap domain
VAVIHNTTMQPGKLDLLTAWLPAQPWYLGTGRRQPELTRAGGFRLDDPAGEVGIEFMVVADAASGDPVFYLVPMTYRGDPLPGADDALIGTSEHGVLGTRWIYDGVRDPVLVAQLLACVQGQATPQAQNASDTPDPTVTATPLAGGSRLVSAPETVAERGPSGTDLYVRTADAPGQLTLRLNRILLPDGDAPRVGEPASHPCLSATWRLSDGTKTRGVFVSTV